MKTEKTDMKTAIDPAFARVVAAFDGDREVALGKMFSSKAVLNVRGKIFAMLVRGRFVAKLPRARVEELVARGGARPFDPGHGRLMKEWVEIEGRPATWVALAREARRYVGGGR
jgi:hypothetical protein